MYSKDRYSIAYFCHPADDTPLEAVPSSRVQGTMTDVGGGLEVGYGGGAGQRAGGGKGGSVGVGESSGAVLTAKEHLRRRLEATYGFRHE